MRQIVAVASSEFLFMEDDGQLGGELARLEPTRTRRPGEATPGRLARTPRHGRLWVRCHSGFRGGGCPRPQGRLPSADPWVRQTGTDGRGWAGRGPPPPAGLSHVRGREGAAPCGTHSGIPETRGAAALAAAKRNQHAAQRVSV